MATFSSYRRFSGSWSLASSNANDEERGHVPIPMRRRLARSLVIGQLCVRRRPARLCFLRVSVSPWLFSPLRHRGTERVLWVGSSVARISFRVFRVVRGYIPIAVAGPAVAAVLRSLAGDNLREDERHVAEQTGCSEPRDCVSVPRRTSVPRGR